MWIARFDISTHLSPIELFATSFGMAFLSGFLPLINIEAYLVTAVVLGGASRSLDLVVAATLGQMAAKTLLYLGGRGVVELPFKHHLNRVERMHERLIRRPAQSGLVLFVSAFVGMPPFYLLSILAGTLRVPAPLFVVAGIAGRFLRFALFVWTPQLMTRIPR